MKNLIDPLKLAELKSKPITFEILHEFLRKDPKLKAGTVCKVLGIPPTSYYSWRQRQERAKVRSEEESNSSFSEVVPTGANKKTYSPNDKVVLLRDFLKLSEDHRGAFLRSYGLYHSDLQRWQKVADDAAMEAFQQKKQGRAGKSAEQLKIEDLQRELQGQEKVISKLSAIVVVQKKISTILGLPDPN